MESSLRLQSSLRRKLWLAVSALTVNILTQSRGRLCHRLLVPHPGKFFATPMGLRHWVLDIAVPMPTIHFLLTSPVSPSLYQPTNQPTKETTNQPKKQPTNQRNNQPTNQRSNQLTKGTTNQPINQPTDRPSKPYLFPKGGLGVSVCMCVC